MKKGPSPDWFLQLVFDLEKSYENNNNPNEIKEKIIKLFKDGHVSKEDLFVISTQQDYYPGVNPLWMLLYITAKKNRTGCIDIANAMWEEFSDELTFEECCFASQSGDEKGISIFWLLLMADLNPSNTYFLTIWNKYKEKFTLQALLASPTDPSYKFYGVSVLYLLTRTAILAKDYHCQILNDIIIKFPGAFNEPALSLQIPNYPALKELIQTFSKEQNKDTWLFISAKSALASFLNTHKTKTVAPQYRDILESNVDDEKFLQTFVDNLIKITKETGFHEAFYHIGEWLKSQEVYVLACKFYKEVPKPSIHYFAAMENAANLNLWCTLDKQMPLAYRHMHLRKALQFALEIRVPETRKDLIQQIACRYCKKLDILTQQDYFLTEEVLNAKNQSAQWYFQKFEEIDLDLSLLQKNEADLLHRFNKLNMCVGNQTEEANLSTENQLKLKLRLTSSSSKNS
ncbi:MAG: hypothetical protein JSS07_02520 [Proteobacteria bacterium]|nr:hypothetical protein [Pseudomonadota bacterium]